MDIKRRLKSMPMFLLTFVIIHSLSLLFLITQSSFLWIHVSPAVPFIVGYVYFLSNSFFIFTVLLDPGSIPKKWKQNQAESNVDGSEGSPLIPESRQVEINGKYIYSIFFLLHSFANISADSYTRGTYQS
jgi:hypothetical protein